MLKVTKSLAQDIFSNVFNIRNRLNYNLLHASHVDVPQVSSVYIKNGNWKIGLVDFLEAI